MRFLVPAALTVLTLAAVATCFLTWGVVENTWGGLSERDGWRDGAPAMILFPLWVGDWHMPHFAVPVALGLAALAGWGRACGYGVPAVVSVILSGFAAYHTGAYLWFFASGKADYLMGSSVRGARPAVGLYLVLAVSLSALAISVTGWRHGRPSRPAARP
jgi:hypothetical protein